MAEAGWGSSRPSKEREEEKRRPLLGQSLLPRERCGILELGHLTTGLFWEVAHSLRSNFGLTGPTAPEDSRMRMLVSMTTPRVALLELNSVATFNMMDPVLAADFYFMIDSYHVFCQQTRDSRTQPLGVIVQGAGPHFCPGGNHTPPVMEGATPWTMSSRSLATAAFIRVQELAVPSVTVASGNLIGGGVALSLQSTSRVAAVNTTMCFGNLSRGACPIMLLSRNLPKLAGMAAAVEIYLTDNTVTAYGAMKAGLVSNITGSIQLAKQRAFLLARRLAATPSCQVATLLLPALNNLRLSDEAHGFMRGNGAFHRDLAATKDAAAAETVQLRVRGPKAALAAGPWGEGEVSETEAFKRRRSRAVSRVVHEPIQAEVKPKAEEPRPFPAGSNDDWLTPGPMAVLSSCLQCGDLYGLQDVGGRTYCGVCAPRMGLAANPRSRYAEEARAQTSTPCSGCGTHTSNGKRGAGVFSAEFYCFMCWKKWHQGVSRDLAGLSTDHTMDSCTEGTVLDSDASFADGSDFD